MSNPSQQNSKPLSSIVVGAGAWGLALTHVLHSSNHRLKILTREQTIESLKSHKTNTQKLPNYKLPDDISLSCDRTALEEADHIFLVIPAKNIPTELELWQGINLSGKTIVLCSKGLDKTNNQFLSQTIREKLPKSHLAILSGPSFATDVAAGLPTAVTLAMDDLHQAKQLCESITTAAFRLYHTDDCLGVEVGGVVKNVLAICAGIVEGANLGASAKAATITRGFAEMVRFGLAMGAKSQTLSGLSGLGDLILTTSSPQSRNFSLGLTIGQEGKFAPHMEHQALAEGFYTAPTLLAKAQNLNIDMPLVEAVNSILQQKISVEQAIHNLLNRPQKAEII